MAFCYIICGTRLKETSVQRNGVQVPAQKRHCKRETVPKQHMLCDLSDQPLGKPGKAGNGRREQKLSYRKSGYSVPLVNGRILIGFL